MRVIGVIPAAGHALRLQPLHGSKEVLPVQGRPVMDFLVERMRAAPADEIRVVTRFEKADVRERAAAFGASIVLGEPASVAESITLGLEGLEPDDVVLVGFPDTIWEPVTGFATLLEALEGDAVLGLFRTPDAARSDVVLLDDSGRVTGIAVKPPDPPSDLIWGCAAVRRRALDGLADHREPGELVDRLAKDGRVGAVHLSDTWLDVGTKAALAAARA